MAEASDFIRIDPIRSPATIENFRMACRLTDRAFEILIGLVAAGMPELDLLARVHEAAQIARAELAPHEDAEVCFVIIESGVRTALLHGRATDKRIEKGDFVTIDFGLSYHNAMADFTRTFVVGRASERQREIYAIVREAILACEDRLKPGMTGGEADAIARDIIANAGYGERFIHTLGHGFGDRSVDKLRSSDGICLAPGESQTVLAPGMVFTIEPGIYIEGFGGVRIEDTVAMGENGVEPLFAFTKDLMEIEA